MKQVNKKQQKQACNFPAWLEAIPDKEIQGLAKLIWLCKWLRGDV